MAIHLLRYVPECPRCGSYNTGFELYSDGFEDINKRLFLANRGMKTIFKHYPCEDICFCDDCNYEWKHRPKLKIMKKEEYIQLREDKQLKALIEELKRLKVSLKLEE